MRKSPIIGAMPIKCMNTNNSISFKSFHRIDTILPSASHFFRIGMETGQEIREVLVLTAFGARNPYKVGRRITFSTAV